MRSRHAYCFALLLSFVIQFSFNTLGQSDLTESPKPNEGSQAALKDTNVKKDENGGEEEELELEEEEEPQRDDGFADEFEALQEKLGQPAPPTPESSREDGFKDEWDALAERTGQAFNQKQMDRREAEAAKRESSTPQEALADGINEIMKIPGKYPSTESYEELMQWAPAVVAPYNPDDPRFPEYVKNFKEIFDQTNDFDKAKNEAAWRSNNSNPVIDPSKIDYAKGEDLKNLVESNREYGECIYGSIALAEGYIKNLDARNYAPLNWDSVATFQDQFPRDGDSLLVGSSVYGTVDPKSPYQNLDLEERRIFLIYKDKDIDEYKNLEDYDSYKAAGEITEYTGEDGTKLMLAPSRHFEFIIDGKRYSDWNGGSVEGDGDHRSSEDEPVRLRYQGTDPLPKTYPQDVSKLSPTSVYETMKQKYQKYKK